MGLPARRGRRQPMESPTDWRGYKFWLFRWSGYGFLDHHVSRKDTDFFVSLGVQHNLFVQDVDDYALPEFVVGGPVPSGQVNLKHSCIICLSWLPGWPR